MSRTQGLAKDCIDALTAWYDSYRGPGGGEAKRYVVCAGLVVLQHFMPFSPGNLYRTWLLLAFIMG